MSDPTTGNDRSHRDESETEETRTDMTAETTDLTPDLTTELTPEPAARRGPSVPTIVWGVIFALVAAGVIAAQTTDVNLNLDVTAPAALLVLGVVLVAWGIAGLGRSRLRR